MQFSEILTFQILTFKRLDRQTVNRIGERVDEWASKRKSALVIICGLRRGGLCPRQKNRRILSVGYDVRGLCPMFGEFVRGFCVAEITSDYLRSSTFVAHSDVLSASTRSRLVADVRGKCAKNIACSLERNDVVV